MLWRAGAGAPLDGWVCGTGSWRIPACRIAAFYPLPFGRALSGTASSRLVAARFYFPYLIVDARRRCCLFGRTAYYMLLSARTATDQAWTGAAQDGMRWLFLRRKTRGMRRMAGSNRRRSRRRATSNRLKPLYCRYAGCASACRMASAAISWRHVAASHGV